MEFFCWFSWDAGFLGLPRFGYELPSQGAALQHEARGKLKDRDKDKAEDEEEAEKGEEGEKDGERGDSSGNGAAGGAGASSQAQGPVDALRAGAGGGKESAFFQDSGAVPTKLEQEDQEVCSLARSLVISMACRHAKATYPLEKGGVQKRRFHY